MLYFNSLFRIARTSHRNYGGKGVRLLGATINYRLSGEATWPIQIHDCKAAIRWLRVNAKKWGGNPEKIGIWGSSAGGHLVAMLGTRVDVPAMEGKVGAHLNASSKVTCVVNFYGPTDLLQMDKASRKGAKMKHNSPTSPESMLIGGPIQEHAKEAATANPMNYVTSDDAPFLIAHGTQDPLVPYNQSELLQAKLTEAGVDNTFITIDGGGHGSGFSPVIPTVIRFFKHHLLGVESKWEDQTVKATNSKF